MSVTATQSETVFVEANRFAIKGPFHTLWVEEHGGGSWRILLADSANSADAGDPRGLANWIEDKDDAIRRATAYVDLFGQAQRLHEEAARLEHDATLIIMGREVAS